MDITELFKHKELRDRTILCPFCFAYQYVPSVSDQCQKDGQFYINCQSGCGQYILCDLKISSDENGNKNFVGHSK